MAPSDEAVPMFLKRFTESVPGKNTPRRITPPNMPTLTMVRIFCVQTPDLTPATLIAVKSIIDITATI